MRFPRSRSGKKIAGWLGSAWAALLLIHNVLDFIIGKIGWLGVFTSPEDFQTMMDRAPQWLSRIGQVVAPAWFWCLGFADQAINVAVSYKGLVTVLLIGLLLFVVDVDAWRRRLSFAGFKVKSVVREHVWISQAKAAEILRESEWGRLVAPHVVETTSFLDDLSLASRFTTTKTTQGLSKEAKAKLKFNVYIRKILQQFAATNDQRVRASEGGGTEYDEASIRELADKLLDDEITSEFGSLPDVHL